MSSAPVQSVLSRLQEVTGYQPKQHGDHWSAVCPAHDDKNPSLSITQGDDGRVLMYCHSGCVTDAIVKSLGMPVSDLFPPNGRSANANRPKQQNPTGTSGKDRQDNTRRTAPQRRAIVAAYPYVNSQGVLIFETVRYEPKDFRQRRPDGNGGYVWNLDGVERVLYRLPDVLAANDESFIFCTEGEKDCNSLTDAGLFATTCSGGAGKSNLTDLSPLHGHHVIVLPHNDSPGHKHAEQVAAALHGKAESVRVLHLPDLPEGGGDVTNWLDAGHDPEDLVQLAEAAPLWTPTAEDAPLDGKQQEHDLSHSPIVVTLKDVQPESVTWLWPGRIAIGKLTMIAGDPGLGKSFLSLDIASRVSTGTGWPDRPGERFKPGGVILLSAEDDLADTIRPRLDAAGANVSRIAAIQAVQHRDDETGEPVELLVNLTRDLDAIATAIEQMNDCRLVIVDPISAYLGGTDSHKNTDVRAALHPLSTMASTHGVALLAITHLNKNQGTSAVYRMMGSLAFAAAARAVWGVTKDQDAPSARRLFLPVKNNLAIDQTGLAFALRDNGTMCPNIAWESEPVTATIDEALGPANEVDTTERDEASAWLTAMLTDGPVPTKDIQTQAKVDGIAWATIRRAKTELGITASKKGFSGDTRWTWQLPDEGAQP